MKKWLAVIALVAALASPALAQSNAEKAEMQKVLEKHFKTYTIKPLTPAQHGELLNKAAAERPGWKLLGKKTGNICPMPNGVTISCDFVVYGPTKRGWDVILGTIQSGITGPNGDGEDMTGAIKDGSRSIVDPVGGPVDVPDPPPPATFDPTLFIQRIDELQSRIAFLSGQLANALDAEKQQRDRLSEALSQAIARIETLEHKPVPVIPTDCYTGLPFLSCGFKY